jgi:hypothetical protein
MDVLAAMNGSNFEQINRKQQGFEKPPDEKKPLSEWLFFVGIWRPHGDSNPGTHRERVMS